MAPDPHQQRLHISPSKNDPARGNGQTLQGTNAPAAPLSTEEMRRQRLARLERSIINDTASSIVATSAVTASTTASATATAPQASSRPVGSTLKKAPIVSPPVPPVEVAKKKPPPPSTVPSAAPATQPLKEIAFTPTPQEQSAKPNLKLPPSSAVLPNPNSTSKPSPNKQIRSQFLPEVSDDIDKDLQAVLALSMAPSSNAKPNPTEDAASDIKQPASSLPISVIQTDNKPQDDVDEDLQAALALSLSGPDEPPTTEKMSISSTPTQEIDSDVDLAAAMSLSLQGGCNSDNDEPEEDKKIAAVPKPALTNEPTVTAKMYPVHSYPRDGSLTEDVASWYKTGRPVNVGEFHDLMWDSFRTTQSDKLRWVGQGINFRDHDPEGKLQNEASDESTLAAIITNHGPWGLTQAHGGPCGVMAAVQAELLRLLLFGSTSNINESRDFDYPDRLTNQKAMAKPDLSEPTILRSLAMAIAVILARAALSAPVDDYKKESPDEPSTRPYQAEIVLPLAQKESQISWPLAWESFEPWTADAANGMSSKLAVYTVAPLANAEEKFAKRQKTDGSDVAPAGGELLSVLDKQIFELARAITKFLLQTPEGGRPPLECFRQAGGVILLVMSMALSRGTQLVLDDMDDSTAKLTAQFGHCGQELINLLLTGHAVSNVFDNSLSPSGELTCRGIRSRSAIGYLTQLEAMRYLEVGGYYKTPRFPIWVVGSTSHFTVMFGDVMALKESKSDALLEKCRRAFKSIDGGEENGFIAVDKLGQYFKDLDLNLPDHGIATLAATMEVPGAGIVLWEDLWKNTSRLMTGASLESVLQLSDTPDLPGSDKPPPLLLMNHADGDDDKKPSAHNNIPAAAAAPNPLMTTAESDEEMARRLATEWDEGGHVAFHPGAAARNLQIQPAPAAAAAAPQPDVPLTDEELARRLQEEWNSAIPASGASTVNAARESPIHPGGGRSASDDISTIATTSSLDQRWEPIPIAPAAPKRPEDFESRDRTFQMYHYNGLRGGHLKAFRVTRLSAEEAVGASITLGNNTSSSGMNANGDLEDVIRTKWVSSMINWLGGKPPSID